MSLLCLALAVGLLVAAAGVQSRDKEDECDQPEQQEQTKDGYL